MNKYILSYPTNKISEPVISKTILETKASINILQATVTSEEGTLIVSIEGGKKSEAQVVKLLRKYGLTVETLSHSIHKDPQKCTDCGVCIGVCPVDAITLADDYEVLISDQECIGCGLCVDACPLVAITLKR